MNKLKRESFSKLMEQREPIHEQYSGKQLLPRDAFDRFRLGCYPDEFAEIKKELESKPIDEIEEHEAIVLLVMDLPKTTAQYVAFIDKMDKFTITATGPNGKSECFEYSVGVGRRDKNNKPTRPDKLDVWYSLAMDTVTVLNSGPTMDDLIDSLVSEFGYDDPVGAYKTAKALTENYVKIKNIGITTATISRWNELFCQANY